MLLLTSISHCNISLQKRLKIPCEFLKHHPFYLEVFLEDFQKGLVIVKKLKVVNDTVERGVKLMEEFNSVFTKKEDQRQFLLQVVRTTVRSSHAVAKMPFYRMFRFNFWQFF